MDYGQNYTNNILLNMCNLDNNDDSKQFFIDNALFLHKQIHNVNSNHIKTLKKLQQYIDCNNSDNVRSKVLYDITHQVLQSQHIKCLRLLIDTYDDYYDQLLHAAYCIELGKSTNKCTVTKQHINDQLDYTANTIKQYINQQQAITISDKMNCILNVLRDVYEMIIDPADDGRSFDYYVEPLYHKQQNLTLFIRFILVSQRCGLSARGYRNFYSSVVAVCDASNKITYLRFRKYSLTTHITTDIDLWDLSAYGICHMYYKCLDALYFDRYKRAKNADRCNYSRTIDGYPYIHLLSSYVVGQQCDDWSHVMGYSKSTLLINDVEDVISRIPWYFLEPKER